MTIRLTKLQNNTTGLPAEDHRLIGRRMTPGTNLHGRTGILPAAVGFRGEVTLLNDTSLTINPFTANIAGTQAVAQGDYEVANDAALTRTITARQAGLSRVDLLVTRVRDTAYTPNEGANDAVCAVIPGTPAATGAVAPAVPVNALVHGTLTVPATGAGSVTYTPATVPTPVAVGGAEPISAADATTVGRYHGQLRVHPTKGLEMWDATASSGAGAWVLGDTGWVDMVPPTPFNSGSGGSVGSTGCSWRRVGKVVEIIVDLIWSGSYAAGTLFATLPQEAWPTRSYYDQGIWRGTVATCPFQVNTDGRILYAAATNPGQAGVFLHAMHVVA